MRVYVAGRLTDFEQVMKVQEWAREEGHTITHDWTLFEAEWGTGEEKDHRDHATLRQRGVDDLNGVRTAELVIAIGHPEVHGTLWECGMACALDIPLMLVGWWNVGRKSVFTHLDYVWETDLTYCLAYLQGQMTWPESRT